jgi:predicted nucleic acid-binding protein
MNVCLDACFLIGLYDPRDQHHRRAAELFADLFEVPSPHVAILVWPVLFESVSTRLVKQKVPTTQMERDLRILRTGRRLDYLDDSPYRERALEACFRELDRSPSAYRALSLTDRVLRSVLSDVDNRVDAILTFNEGDFADVCKRSGCRLLS